MFRVWPKTANNRSKTAENRSNTAENRSKTAENDQNQAENKELNIGDDQGDWSALGLKPKVENKAQTQREKALPVHDGWQSWA